MRMAQVPTADDLAAKKKKRSSYTWRGEMRTGGGQLVSTDVLIGDISGDSTAIDERFRQVTTALQHVSHIRLPDTHPANVPHGGYGRYSRYTITQHRYAGGGGGGNGGYLELLEIADPPDNRAGWVVYVYFRGVDKHVNCFYEFATGDDAQTAWKKQYSKLAGDEPASTIPGCIRRVDCGALTPWFYAVAEQHLLGDVVFPDVVEDDPVFAFGRKFVVTDIDAITTIKTCYGLVPISGYEYSRSGYSGAGKEYTYWRVYWHDGTCTDLDRNHSLPANVRPAASDELWVEQAVEKFRQLLSGQQREFEIPFLDGESVVVKWRPRNPRAMTAEGEYYATITVMKEGKEVTEAGHFDFTPTADYPDVVTYLQKGKPNLQSIQELRRLKEGKRPGEKVIDRKWSGVFKRRPPAEVKLNR